MDKIKIDKWVSAIVQEDGHNLSSGSLRTLKMIRDEIQKPVGIDENEKLELETHRLNHEIKLHEGAHDEWRRIVKEKNDENEKLKKENEEEVLTKEQFVKWFYSQSPYWPTPDQVYDKITKEYFDGGLMTQKIISESYAEKDKNQIKELQTQLQQGIERERELEDVLKMAYKKYADEMTNPFCMEWYKKATKLLNK